MPKPTRTKAKAVICGAKPSEFAPPTCESKSDSDPLESFEVELLWCIRQLEASLISKKMSARLAQDSVKNLNTLKSNKAPLIKKRQIMRSVFGDYRAKMAEEERKFYKANSNVKFATLPPMEKSQFLKKSSSSKGIDDSTFSYTDRSLLKEKEASDDEVASFVTTQEQTADNTKKNKSFTFKRSDNSFRFHFSVGDVNI